MTIPGLVNTQQIEHIFSSGMQVRISGTLNLETKTLTASVKLTDGSQLKPEIRPLVERELWQMYKDFTLILQY
jgi:hypothetical protein